MWLLFVWLLRVQECSFFFFLAKAIQDVEVSWGRLKVNQRVPEVKVPRLRDNGPVWW